MIEEIIQTLCNGCGICDLACPMDVLYAEPKNETVTIRYPDDCMTCFNCEVVCPTNAVRVDPIRAPKPQAW
jgi:NAD-dependent dihydropyrimidine dehydrogenase PreA subunit